MLERKVAPPDTDVSRSNLIYLQEEALAVIAVIAGIFGYVWLWLDIWPITGAHAPLDSWIGGGVLAGGTLFSHYLRTNHLRLSTYLLISTLLIAIVCAALTFPLPAMMYLLTLPVIFASVLLSQRGVFLTGLLVGVTMLTIQASRVPLDFDHVEALLPIGV